MRKTQLLVLFWNGSLGHGVGSRLWHWGQYFFFGVRLVIPSAARNLVSASMSGIPRPSSSAAVTAARLVCLAGKMPALLEAGPLDDFYASRPVPICTSGPVLRRGVIGVSSSTSGSL